MKRWFVILLAALASFSLAACQGKESSDGSGASSDWNSSETAGSEEESVKSSLDLLTAVWNGYEENEKFPAAGGDMSEEHMTMDAPGIFSMDDTAALDATLGIPKAAAEKMDDAASLVHMMNANTFTCGAFHVKNAEDTTEIASAVKDNLMQRQWICGFPDKLVIARVGDYMISFFGEKEIVDTFRSKLTETYPLAEMIYDEAID